MQNSLDVPDFFFIFITTLFTVIMKKLISLILFLLLSCPSFAQVVKHHSYTTYYNAGLMEPDSVVWTLTSAMVSCGKQTRVDQFAADPAIKGCAQPSDYAVNKGKSQGNKIDLGHLFNFEDASCNAVDRVECFYTSNMLPQYDSFNKGDWKTLETQERVWAKTAALRIIAGGIGSVGKLPKGENIPKYMWKAIFMNGQWTAWIMPNDSASKGHKYAYWEQPLAELDQQTGLKLYNNRQDFLAIVKNIPTGAKSKKSHGAGPGPNGDNPSTSQQQGQPGKPSDGGAALTAGQQTQPGTGAASADSPNTWQTIVTILFALSMISERIANLIKLQFFETSKIQLRNYEQQRRHEKNTMWAAIACGTVTSFVAGADLFVLLSGHLAGFHAIISSKGWDLAQHLLGIVLTGFFVSLGSKFWHDVLDIVLQFANLKKYQAGAAQQNNQQLNTDTQTITLNKLNAIKGTLLTMPGFSGYQADPNSSAVNIMFDAKTPITAAGMASLNTLLGAGTFNIIPSNIKLA
jgi:DNA/RNA endonuclease G (NUC1)